MKPKENKHIISASRRTDIPAFFAEWFEKQLEQNYCEYNNPFFPQKKYRVGLSALEVDGFVFWTRYPIPFLKVLKTIMDKNYAFYFQFTLNAYPKSLEPSTPDKEEAISAFKKLARCVGKERIIWRYDPILLANGLNSKWHKQNFLSILHEIYPCVASITTSIIDFYEFNKNQLLALGVEEEKEPYFDLLYWMGEKSREYGLSVRSCAEELPSNLGIVPAGCVDAIFLALSNKKEPPKHTPTLHKLRKNCLCHRSIDIGTNHTCKFNCIYCYANNPKMRVAAWDF